MYKKLAMFIFVIGLSVLLLGCNSLGIGDVEELTDYQIWRNSDEAEDLNGDRKIDELDYEIYLNPPVSDYETWRNSDEAEDLNGDRKIDELDYEIYLNPPLSDYEIWKDSNKADDLNNDGKIDEIDYGLFLELSEFAGHYQVTNFAFEGENLKVGNKNNLESIGQHLSQILVSVDDNGDIEAYIPIGTIISLDDIYEMTLEGFNNMTLTRISPFIVVMDTYLTIENVRVNATLYLLENENGFSTTYTIDYDGFSGKITFDLIKLQSPSTIGYESWKASNDSSDLNGDGTIDEVDYEIFLQFNDISGNYQINNYEYEGRNLEVGDQNDLESLGQHLKQMLFTVSETGQITVFIPNSTIISLADIYEITLEGLDNAVLRKISPFIFVIDSHVTINDLEVNFTLYLNETVNGFTISYLIDFDGFSAVISFDLIRMQ